MSVFERIVRTFRREEPKPAPRPVVRVFKTITLGRYKTPNEYKAALKAGGFDTDFTAGYMMTREKAPKEVVGPFPIAAVETEVDLVALTPAELGFTPQQSQDRYSADDRRIFGLRECPAEVGPALRLAYPEQPEEECLNIVMLPIEILGEESIIIRVFCVCNDRGKKSLRGNVPGGGIPFYPDMRKPLVSKWVFVKPRP